MIVATAGHVDHGKSTLVRELTGTDPDRWDEEKRRGLTIDLGFAWMPGPDGLPGSTIAFVDVPGHRRFMPNMLAGCGAVDIGLLVVSAREGWMPQTEEHLQILDLLGVRRGVVALTHADVVEPGVIADATAEIAARLAGTTLNGSPTVPTARGDAQSIDTLRACLRAEAVTGIPGGTGEDRRRPRLWIDRSFALRGTGRVVTGTLTGGRIRVGDEVVVAGARGEQPASVRGVHANGKAVDRAEPGLRVGLALSRLESDPVRGDAIVLAGQWTGGRRWQVALRKVRNHPEPLAGHGGYQVFVGTARSPSQLRFGAERADRTVEGSAPEFGRLHLREPLAPVTIGDRFVLRDEGTDRTVAGGVILAVDAETRRYPRDQLEARWRALVATDDDPNRRAGRLAELLLGDSGGSMEADLLARELGPLDALADHPVERAGRHVVHSGEAQERRDEILEAIGSSNVVAEPQDALGRVVADRLVDEGRIERLSGTLGPAGRGTDERREAIRRMTEVLEGSEAPLLTIEELRSEAGSATSHRSAGVRAGALVEVGPFLTTPTRFEELATAVEESIDQGCSTVGAIRERIGLTRKYVLPLLETLDAQGRTERNGDERTWVAS